MSRIRGKDTLPERMVAGRAQELGLAWEAHARDLPGCPDMVFRSEKVAVFIDGDFWHGWHFPQWKAKLSEAWEMKIDTNRRRDQRNHRRLRRQGWTIVRLWEHQIYKDLAGAVARILAALGIKY